MKQVYALIIFLLLLTLPACHKESNNSGQGRVIVVNEGGYKHQDASISVYDPTTHMAYNNLYSQANNGAVLGDVAQSLYLIGDTAYIVMNNSQKIVLASVSKNFRYIGAINLPNSSPRFFLPVDGRRAYVTDLYADKIWVVDYRADSVLKSIPVAGWTDQLILQNGKVYVEEATKPYLGTGAVPSTVHAILMIDPSSDQVVNTLPLASDPGSMVLTAQNKLFVLAPQQTTPASDANLYRIDLATFSIEKEFDFGATRIPNYIRYSTLTDQLLFSDSRGIYIMQPTDTVIPSNTFIQSNNWNVYGLDADPATGDIYISDAVDFQQSSHIMHYSKGGALIDHFTAGIITNGFVFQ